MLLFWRIWAALAGFSLMLGESIRSWGQSRSFWFVADDFFVGIPLVAAALLMARPTVARFAALAAAFAANAGMTYSSFFSKVVAPTQDMASNIEAGLLTWLIGLSFVSSLLGLTATLYLASTHRF